MASPSIDPNDILTAIFKKLKTPLSGVGATAIKGKRRPKGVPNPLATVDFVTEIKDECRLEEFILQVTLHVNNFQDGTANLKKLGEILATISDTLNEEGITVSGVRVFPMWETGKTPALWMNTMPNEHSQALRFRMHAIPEA